MTCYECEHFDPKTKICGINNDEILPEFNTKCDFLNESFKELKAENKRLRKALQEIAEFANEEYENRIPAPSCVKFFTIKRYAEKALKGDKT